MRLSLFALALFTLAACGADGAPEAPASMDKATTGVAISGCAKVGIVTGPAFGGPTRC